MTKIIAFLKGLFSFLFGVFKTSTKGKFSGSVGTTFPESFPPRKLLKPIKHWRYLSIYCIADLKDGDTPILTSRGLELWKISTRSRERLVMEGTGRLSNGKVVNVDRVVNGAWRFKEMGPSQAHGVGIRNKALEPWVSVAHSLQQLRTHSLFGRKVVIPQLKGYETPDGKILDGTFLIHDTGGGLRKCPFYKGLWRTGETKSKYGQFDLFIGGPETMYKGLLKTWNSYKEVFLMPRDTETNKGIQETLNLLLDAGLTVDGVIGPKSTEAISQIQAKAGIEDQSGVWCSETKRFAELSLENWDESL